MVQANIPSFAAKQCQSFLLPKDPPIPGLDLNDAGSAILNMDEQDIARKAVRISNLVKQYQQSFTAIEQVIISGGNLPKLP